MQGHEADEDAEGDEPSVNLVAVEAFRGSPCELDHMKYDAIRTIDFVSASAREINETYFDDLSGKPWCPN